MSLSVVAADAFKEAPSLQSSSVFTEQGFNLSGTDRPDRVMGARVEHEFFALLGFDAMAGRLFAADEDGPGGARVAVLSERLWERRFGRDRTMVGRQIRLDGVPYTVVGIAPADLKIPSIETDLWIPFIPDSSEMDPATRPLALLGADPSRSHGRRPDARSGGDRFARLGGRVRRVRGPRRGGRDARRTTWYGPEFHRAIVILMLTVLFVLLIACANLANLMLARASARSLRSRCGSPSAPVARRLVRKLMAESVLSPVGSAPGSSSRAGASPRWWPSSWPTPRASSRSRSTGACSPSLAVRSPS